MNIKTISSDHLGVFTSVACMLHCLTTPLLFITQAQASTLSHEVPFLWQSMNYLFIIVSLAAITRSVRNSTNSYVKIFLISAWSLFSFFIINESFEIYHISEFFTYLAAITLSALHIYNLKYCTCKDEDCCTHKN
ncbi:MAG: MerC domain-containing protein [Flavobacteriaceae bacterium]|nr:MerC domain-containing protein [Flavobacteriaceae bacterium]